jgi:serine/threonine protein kinase
MPRPDIHTAGGLPGVSGTGISTAGPSAATDHAGRYELLRKLADGGMAEIFLARSRGIEGFERLVVIKRMHSVLAADPEFVRMFVNEGRLAAQLHHANIVQVFEIGQEAGRYFLAMEYVPGEDLRRVLKAVFVSGRKMPLEYAVAVIASTLAGLQHAHELRGQDGRPLGIVHRDVSPQNVLVTHDGNVKLLDFGIAKATQQLSETKHGTLKGKIRYMSPEQCQTLDLDRRTDIFATGILLWEMTVGRRLHDGIGEFDVMKQIVELDAPKPSSFVEGYPPELEEIVMKALRRPVSERYQTAEEMQVALEEFARERKLNTSRVQLTRFMRELFGAKIDAWENALDVGGGTVVDQVAEQFADSSSGDLFNGTGRLALENDQHDLATIRERLAPTVPEVRAVAVPRTGQTAARRRQRSGGGWQVMVAGAFAVVCLVILGLWLFGGRSPEPPSVAPAAAPAAEEVATEVAPSPPETAPPPATPSSGAAARKPAASERTNPPKKKKPASPTRSHASSPADLDAPLPP